MAEIAVIGAGIAGLICAQRLQQAGHRVIVLEKSRGLGGRMATRRLAGTCADHGVRYLDIQGSLSKCLILALQASGILHQWIEPIDSPDGSVHAPTADRPRYVATEGITAVAKFLGQGLTIWRSQRVQSIIPNADRAWKLAIEPSDGNPGTEFMADTLVLAIPAPQALMLVEPLATTGVPAEFLAALQKVEFAPCLTAIATYSVHPSAHPHGETSYLPWQGVALADDPTLAWVAIETSKRPTTRTSGSDPVVVVLQSTPQFAARYLDAPDLRSAGYGLVTQAANTLLPGFNNPATLQVHRWRYAFATQPLSVPYLKTDMPLPLVCCGDWCGGHTIEAALRSGLLAARQILTDELADSLSDSRLDKELADILKPLQVDFAAHSSALS